MNLFVLDYMPVTAAQCHSDKHVTTGIVDAVKMMGYAYSRGKFKPLPRLGAYYKQHQMCQWVRATRQNFDWTLQYAQALCFEYKHRFDAIPLYQQHVEWIGFNLPLDRLPDLYLSEWPRCFGKLADVIETTDSLINDYRRYYKVSQRYAAWTRRPIPEWFS
jgi:hypothetical protein